MIQTLEPKTEQEWLELRLKDITSTEASALFGLSPYQTIAELWHRKKNQELTTFTPNERMLWGTRLQAAIAEGVALDKNWLVRPMREYMRDDELRIGSSFDYSIEGFYTAEKPNEITPTKGLLEIKNVDALQYREKWAGDDDDLEAPPHIEIQVQHQLLVSNRKSAFIAALIGGNQVKIIKRVADQDVMSQIKMKAKEFWQSIDDNKPPEYDFAKDAELIKHIYSFASPGKTIDADGEISSLVAQYKEVSEQEKRIGETKDAIKAMLLTLVGDAEKVKGQGFSISAGMVGPTRIEYDRAGYRNFRVSFSKTKRE
jgi:putative phage-type endonuclease